jgi:hypothetical protein
MSLGSESQAGSCKVGEGGGKCFGTGTVSCIGQSGGGGAGVGWQEWGGG